MCGTLKTTQWALAAFQGSAFRNRDGIVSGQLDRTGDVQFSVQIDGQPLLATHQRAGPVGRPSGAPDQCLFVRYYKMKRRLLGREPMQAAAGPHQLPPGPDNSGPDAMSPGRAPRASPSVDNECNDVCTIAIYWTRWGIGTNLHSSRHTTIRSITSSTTSCGYGSPLRFTFNLIWTLRIDVRGRYRHRLRLGSHRALQSEWSP